MPDAAPPRPAPAPPAAALLDAARTGDGACVDALLRDDPALAVHARDGVGDRAPIVAAFHGHRALAGRLGAAIAAAGGALDAWEATLVGDAARLAGCLAADPALPRARRADGWTLLHLAGFAGRAALVDLLCDAGADPDARAANAMANTALHAALALGADQPTVERLVARGADVRAAAGGGWTPLHLAASRGDLPAIALLLARGADPAARADDGQPPAAVAAARGHPQAAARLRAASG